MNEDDDDDDDGDEVEGDLDDVELSDDDEVDNFLKANGLPKPGQSTQ